MHPFSQLSNFLRGCIGIIEKKSPLSLVVKERLVTEIIFWDQQW